MKDFVELTFEENTVEQEHGTIAKKLEWTGSDVHENEINLFPLEINFTAPSNVDLDSQVHP